MANPPKLSHAEYQKWIIDKSFEARTPSLARKMLLGLDPRSRVSPMVGKMFFFKYDPKGKNYLPKYDNYPLVVVLNHYANGFFGINLHYLDVGTRIALVQELNLFLNNNYLDTRTKLNVNYDLIKNTPDMASLAHPCYKRYLFNHVRSRFIEIFPDEYFKAIQSPLEQFHFNVPGVLRPKTKSYPGAYS